MRYITQATEKRIKEMVKNEHKFGKALERILDDMKSREGWYGATIKEMKDAGYQLENNARMNVSYYFENIYIGLTVLFSDLFYATFTLDLHYASIYDFNKLVKVVSELEYNGYGVY